MKETGVDSKTAAFGLALAITSLLSAILVVIKELNQDTVLALMKSATGHHWVSHGIFVLIVFLVLGWVLARGEVGSRLSGNALSAIISASIVLSALIIAGFFI
ncbi:hypothetical protein [Marinobacterium arenosum]|uniref:hypothetical protein n=1 Tax=Marinobacterium arenosum TaxID=2862496 RepID=UPI001C97FF98|nr:hypothetical protein [Marinobacterium arenosum]MBY4677593.1 hypothetical protein [Marinobacterium arenosum]